MFTNSKKTDGYNNQLLVLTAPSFSLPSVLQTQPKERHIIRSRLELLKLCLSNRCSARDELHACNIVAQLQHVSEHGVPAIIGVTAVSFQSCSRGLNIYALAKLQNLLYSK